MEQASKQTLKQTFLTPPDEFTPFPFWFWNDALDEGTITRQMEDFREKGVYGFVIHPRMGIPGDLPYLSDRFMHYVKYTVEEARRLGMKVVLYDEAMYPSGSAHGMVAAANPEYATRALRMEEYTLSAGERSGIADWRSISHRPVLEKGEELISVQAVSKNKRGQLSGTVLLFSNGKNSPERFSHWGTEAGALGDFLSSSSEDSVSLLYFISCFSHGTIRGIHEGEDDRQPNAPASADLLNPEAMQCFIHLTHDRYYEVLKEYFGSTVVAMFTDEPDVLGRNHRRDVMPWTKGFLEWWERCGGAETDLPLLWFDSEDSCPPPSGFHTSDSVRCRFREAVNKRLGKTYYRQLSCWCQEHGIALTGHPAKSSDIGLLQYFQVPGQDLVYRWVGPEGDLALTGPDSTMAKCSSDAARHAGKRRNANECFGCCGPRGNQWALTADDLKWFLDWMFVRGVNLLYPHAFFYSFAGELRFGERPPDVGPHNIWWEDYRMFADYIKRMCWLMTDSRNTASIAILCEENDLPWKMAKELFRSQIEFNYLQENLLLSPDEKVTIKDGCLCIAEQSYRLLLVESPRLLSPAMAERLQPFLRQGGQIILLDEENSGMFPPDENLLTISRTDDLIRVLDGLEEKGGLPIRKLNLLPAAGQIRISHLVKEGLELLLLVNEGESAYCGHVLLPRNAARQNLWIEKWHPWEGSCEAVRYALQDGCPLIPIRLERRESLILAMSMQAMQFPADVERTSRTETAAAAFRESHSAREESRTVTLELTGPIWSLGKITPFQGVVDAGRADPGACPQLPSSDNIRLSDWVEWPGMEHFSGTVEYGAVLNCRAQADSANESADSANEPGASAAEPDTIFLPFCRKRVVLDLGEVHEIARLSVNGRQLRTQMWAPYRFDVTDVLKEGENTLRLEIVNAMANAMNHSGLPSGLIGPVTLQIQF